MLPNGDWANDPVADEGVTEPGGFPDRFGIEKDGAAGSWTRRSGDLFEGVGPAAVGVAFGHGGGGGFMIAGASAMGTSTDETSTDALDDAMLALRPLTSVGEPPLYRSSGFGRSTSIDAVGDVAALRASRLTRRCVSRSCRILYRFLRSRFARGTMVFVVGDSVRALYHSSSTASVCVDESAYFEAGTADVWREPCATELSRETGRPGGVPAVVGETPLKGETDWCPDVAASTYWRDREGLGVEVGWEIESRDMAAFCFVLGVGCGVVFGRFTLAPSEALFFLRGG